MLVYLFMVKIVIKKMKKNIPTERFLNSVTPSNYKW